MDSTTLRACPSGFSSGRYSFFRFQLLLVAIGLAGLLTPAAASYAQTANMLGLPAQVVKGAGKLMICGGGPTPAGFRDEFVRLADGAKAKIVIIPTGMVFSDRQEMENRFSSWREFPCESLSFIGIHPIARRSQPR